MKKYIMFIKWLLSKDSIKDYQRYKIEKGCIHAKWDMDNQIKVIQCRKCGKRAWIVDVKDIFTKQ